MWCAFCYSTPISFSGSKVAFSADFLTLSLVRNSRRAPFPGFKLNNSRGEISRSVSTFFPFDFVRVSNKFGDIWSHKLDWRPSNVQSKLTRENWYFIGKVQNMARMFPKPNKIQVFVPHFLWGIHDGRSTPIWISNWIFVWKKSNWRVSDRLCDIQLELKSMRF